MLPIQMKPLSAPYVLSILVMVLALFSTSAFGWIWPPGCCARAPTTAGATASAGIQPTVAFALAMAKEAGTVIHRT